MDIKECEQKIEALQKQIDELKASIETIKEEQGFGNPQKTHLRHTNNNVTAGKGFLNLDEGNPQLVDRRKDLPGYL